LTAISASKQKPLEKLLVALNIRHVGPGAAQELAANFLSLDALCKAGKEDLCLLEGIGEKIADSLVSWLANEKNRSLTEELIRYGLRTDTDLVSSGGDDKPLAGKTFVITGALAAISRESLKTRLENMGAKVTNSVSKNTTALIVGQDPGGKLEKARQLNIDIIEEEALAALFDGSL